MLVKYNRCDFVYLRFFIYPQWSPFLPEQVIGSDSIIYNTANIALFERKEKHYKAKL